MLRSLAQAAHGYVSRLVFIRILLVVVFEYSYFSSDFNQTFVLWIFLDYSQIVGIVADKL